jgi:phosphatidate cytidylyltransferase
MLISNPFASALFLPTLYLGVGIMGGTLLLLLAVTRFDLRRLGESVLFRRWRVWAVIAPVYGLAVLSGELALLLLLSCVVFQGLREYARLVKLPPAYERVLLAMGLVAAPAAAFSVEAFYALPPLLLVLGTLQPLLFDKQPGGVRHLAFAALGWGYIAWLLAHLMLIYNYFDGGAGVLLAVGLGTALSDVGAFAVGKAFGRHKLAPRLSPNKTWEGVAGNLLGACVGVGLVALAVPGGFHWVALGLPVVIAVGSLWGDLLESSIKREFGAKDAGGWLPGFGGLLDRVDSLIIVVPLVMYSMRLAGGLLGGF